MQFNQNTKKCFQQAAYEDINGNIPVILLRPQCVYDTRMRAEHTEINWIDIMSDDASVHDEAKSLSVNPCTKYYRQTSNISHTLVFNKLVDHPDEVGASPVGAAPTTSPIST